VASYVAKHNVPCEYRPVSGCRTFWTEPILKEVLSYVETLRKASPDLGKQVHVVTDEDKLEKCKVQKECPGATITDGAASIWPYKLVTFMLRQLVKDKKINLQTNTPVESIAQNSSASQPSARWSIKTSRGTVTAKNILLATNGYTSHLLPDFSDIVVPVRGTMTALVPPPNAKFLPHSYGFVGFGPAANHHSDDYLVQRPFSDVPNPKGHLMFGGGRASGEKNSMNESDDSFVDNGSVSYLRETLLKTLDLGGETEGLTELKADYAWSGIMGYSRDNSPWVGAIPGMQGLWICAGYTGHGMPNATLCAKAVVEMMESGDELENVKEEMIKGGRLPQSYLITEERLHEANGLPSVKVQDEEGCMGYDSEGRWIVTGKL
jgi:glycine/D-amino acid oxidase-like deaminating enzyme